MVMKRMLKRWLKLIFGWAFILLGVAGLFLPLLQGILFIIIGLVLISKEYRWARALYDLFRRKYPRVAARADRVKKKIKKLVTGTY